MIELAVSMTMKATQAMKINITFWKLVGAEQGEASMG